MTTFAGRQVRLVRQPRGLPKLADFEVVTVSLAAPGRGEVLVRNAYLTVSPGTRLYIDAAAAGPEEHTVLQGIRGEAIGRVLASGSPHFAVGDVVRHMLGWGELARGDASQFRAVPAEPVDDLAGFLSASFTAYAGLVGVAELRPGETVWVSSAAGAVGGQVGQIARLLGAARIIGSVGTAEKARYVTEELGFDVAVNRRDGSLVEQLRAAAPDGVDVYFDNVGGDHLEAALDVVRPHARIVLCGVMSAQSAEDPPPGPANLLQAIAKRVRLQGFTVFDHLHLTPEFADLARRWRADDRLREPVVVIAGIENTPQAFLDLLRGEHKGRLLIRM